MSSNRGWVDRHRKLVALIIIVLVGSGLINLILPRVVPFLPLPSENPSYSFTAWIAPEDQEFILHLDFYGSEQDAENKINRYFGYGIRVEPMDNERNDGYFYNLPENLLSAWVKIYFDEDTEEPRLIIDIRIG
ncbi:MAG: hypothetical protein OEV85_03285 [Candidatus Thorarchaeota archaeon]|nr:hypothetical protein [Candidatus Thorarchaeota archaeon]